MNHRSTFTKRCLCVAILCLICQSVCRADEPQGSLLRRHAARVLENDEGQIVSAILYGPKITDEVLAELLPEMQHITALEMMLTFTTNDAIRMLVSLPKLGVLKIKGTLATDGCGKELASMANLRILALVTIRGLTPGIDELTPSELKTLQKAKISDATLENLGDITQLRGLYLGGIDLNNNELSPLRNLRNLEGLKLTDMDFDDGALKDLEGLSNLKGFNISNIGISGEGLIHLSGAKDLAILSLLNTKLDDAGAEYILQWGKLSEVRIFDSNISKSKGSELMAAMPPNTISLERSLPDLKSLTHPGHIANLLYRQDVKYLYGHGAGVKTEQGRVKILILDRLQKSLKFDNLTCQDIAKRIVDLIDLEALSVNGIPLQDRDIQILSSLKQLRGLILTGTQITDEGARCLVDIRDLDGLGLAKTKITDKSLTHIKKLTSLSKLDLGDTGITDSGLKAVSGLFNLELLRLSNCEISDLSIEHLTKLKQLKVVAINGTNITEDGKTALRKALPDVEIRDKEDD